MTSYSLSALEFLIFQNLFPSPRLMTLLIEIRFLPLNAFWCCIGVNVSLLMFSTWFYYATEMISYDVTIKVNKTNKMLETSRLVRLTLWVTVQKITSCIIYYTIKTYLKSFPRDKLLYRMWLVNTKYMWYIEGLHTKNIFYNYF